MAITNLKTPLEGKLRYSKPLESKVRELITAVNDLTDGAINTEELTLTGLLTAEAGISQGTSDVTEFTVLTTLTATQIVGSTAGKIGHSAGAILVAAPSSDYALEFVSAVIITDYDTAAYTGGADDAVIRVGTVAHSAALTDTNFAKATGDKVYVVRALNTAEVSLPVGSTINLKGTAFTNPGEAAGVIRVYTTYRKITTNL